MSSDALMALSIISAMIGGIILFVAFLISPALEWIFDIVSMFFEALFSDLRVLTLVGLVFMLIAYLCYYWSSYAPPYCC